MNDKVIYIYYTFMSFTVQERLVQIEQKKAKKNCSLALRQQIDTTEKAIERTKIIIKIVKY